jgi:hypothetical protein
VDWLETPPAVLPDPFGQHPAPHGFDAQTQPVTLSQLLGRQRRAKIRVIRLDQRQGRLGMSDISNGEDGDLSNEGLQQQQHVCVRKISGRGGRRARVAPVIPFASRFPRVVHG